MKRALAMFATIVVLTLGVGDASNASQKINQVSALLVYPTVLNESTATGPTWRTFVTVTNIAQETYGVRLFFVDGAGCGWCEAASLSLGANDSETLRFSRNFSTGETEITTIDGATTATCPGANGFAVAVLVDDSTGDVLADNLLIGNSISREEAAGTSFSVEAIGFQGLDGSDGNLNLLFDDIEYVKFPRTLGGTVLAPDIVGDFDATLSLFTLDFNRGTPPSTDCTITATDESGFTVATAHQFGCWTHVDLESIDSEFGYPNWGPVGGREQIALGIDCDVDIDSDGNFDTEGAVHGALSQRVPAGARLRRSDPTSPVLANEAAWSRPLVQSTTPGDAARLSFEICNGVDDDLDSIVDEGCDADGDGFCVVGLGFTGEPAQCVNGVGDCEPDDQSSYPGAVEINDGLDNQCPGDPGYGAVDEISGAFAFVNPGDPETICWPPQQGATAYEVVRSPDPLFPVGSCASAPTVDTCVLDVSDPAPGELFHYLVRALTPNAGSFGVDSDGVERTGICE